MDSTAVAPRTYRTGARSTSKTTIVTTSRPRSSVARSTGPRLVTVTYGGAATGWPRISPPPARTAAEGDPKVVRGRVPRARFASFLCPLVKDTTVPDTP